MDDDDEDCNGKSHLWKDMVIVRRISSYEPVVESLIPSKKREYRVMNRLLEGKKPLYAVTFDFIDSRNNDAFTTVGANRETLCDLEDWSYRCSIGNKSNNWIHPNESISKVDALFQDSNSTRLTVFQSVYTLLHLTPAQ